MSGSPGDSFRLRRASLCIRRGGIVAYPTEAVFGLGCDPSNPVAVSRLLAIKRRAQRKGLILVAADWAQLQPWLQPQSGVRLRRLRESWPGPVTWLVPAASDCPRWLTGEHTTLAVRLSDHPLVCRLCRRVGSALVSTSANISHQLPARTLLQVQLRFADKIDDWLPGPLGGHTNPTCIRDLATGKTLRA